MGGLAGSLSRHADQLFESLSGEDQLAVRRMFSRLVTPGDGTDDTRRRVLVTDLAGIPNAVVEQFVDRRLLTTDRDRATRLPTLEVAHEVLLRSWPRLRDWLAQDRSWLRELRSLTAAAAQWDAGGRNEADLYRGARLAVVAELESSHNAALTELERGFLDASAAARAAQEREALERLAEKAEHSAAASARRSCRRACGRARRRWGGGCSASTCERATAGDRTTTILCPEQRREGRAVRIRGNEVGDRGRVGEDILGPHDARQSVALVAIVAARSCGATRSGGMEPST
jgi:hypothetical protein